VTERRKLDAIELRIDAIKLEIRRVQQLPVPVDEAIERLRADINGGIRYHAIGHSVESYLAADRRDGLLPREVQFLDICWLLGTDEMVARVRARLEAANAGRDCLSTADRLRSIAKLQESLREAEAEAERETLALEAKGYAILRRAKADVAVLFEVWGAMKPHPGERDTRP
jgi:regulator of protease activity HflC (stomatin/prohibitin superfamily)